MGVLAVLVAVDIGYRGVERDSGVGVGWRGGEMRRGSDAGRDSGLGLGSKVGRTMVVN